MSKVTSILGSIFSDLPHEDLEDAAQEAALRTLEASGVANKEAFQVTTAKNLLRNKIRDEHTISIETVAEEELIYDETFETDLRLDVQRALSKFSLKERDILFLHFSEGLSIREIAREKSVPWETIRDFITRARKQLRRDLADYETFYLKALTKPKAA